MVELSPCHWPKMLNFLLRKYSILRTKKASEFSLKNNFCFKTGNCEIIFRGELEFLVSLQQNCKIGLHKRSLQPQGMRSKNLTTSIPETINSDLNGRLRGMAVHGRNLLETHILTLDIIPMWSKTTLCIP